MKRIGAAVAACKKTQKSIEGTGGFINDASNGGGEASTSVLLAAHTTTRPGLG